MLLISENEIVAPKAYLESFAPVVAKLTHSAGGQFITKMICGAGGQCISEDDAKLLLWKPLIRIVIARFENMEQFHSYWNSARRRQIWKVGSRYANFCDNAVALDMQPIKMPLALYEVDKSKKYEPRIEIKPFRDQGNDSEYLDPLIKLGLSMREAEVLSWIARGKTNNEIAVILGLHIGTVKKHVVHILAKLGVETRVAAAVLALEAQAG